MSSAVWRRYSSECRNQRARSCRLSAIDQETDEQWNGPAGAALLGAAKPCRTGNIEMCPLQILGEFPEERCCRAGAAFASADIGNIREIAFQLFYVFFPDRQTPSAVVGA